jgi:uncharacterized protein (DUF983 family)
MSEPTFWQRAHGCPRCGRGALFAGFLRLNAACHACGLPFQQESGQALGAAVVAYTLGALVALPLFLALLVSRQPVAVAIGVPTAVLAVLSPFNVRFSRQLWVHAMFQLHRGRPR